MALSTAQEARLVALETTITTLATGLRADVTGLKTALANVPVPASGPDPAVDAAFARLEAKLAPLVALDAETPGTVVPTPPTPPVPPVPPAPPIDGV